MSGKELQADPEDLARLAGEVLASADGIMEALAASRGPSMLPLAAFGNTTAGPDLHLAYERAIAAGARTSERLLEVLEGDVDRLFRVAFAYQELEDENTGLVGSDPILGPK